MKGLHARQRPSEHFPAVFAELPSMRGRNVVVTGASRGLGYVTALSLAKKGARVFLLNRESARSREVLREIAAAATDAPPELVECNLLDFASVRAAAAVLHGRSVDVLCCNAGIMLQPDEASVDGYDITICTNMLSHFLLAKELMPELERAAALRGEARVVSMSSGSGFGPPAFDARFFERRGGSMGGDRASYERYHQSKLANLLFTSALADKLAACGSCVKALACTPGVCATDMYVHAVGNMYNSTADVSRVPSVEDGACGQLLCICSPLVQSGMLLGPPAMAMGGYPVETPLGPPGVLIDDASKEQLWEACERAVGAFDLAA